MARILYGLSGDGYGHATRSKEIITHLQEAGHEVCIVSYEKGYEMMSKFYKVEKIGGLMMKYSNNEVKYLATLGQNLLKSKETISSLEKVRKLAKKFKPDLAITDFEPAVSLTANWLDLPLISVSNQHLITKAKIDVPEKWLTEYLAAKLIVRLIVFNAAEYIVLNFFDVKTTADNAVIVPPIVRREVLELTPSHGEHIFVYLNNQADLAIPVLKDSRANFIVYGLNRQGREDNIIFKPIGGPDYLKDLASARGVIATAGFSLLSEALCLGKPLLALPVKSQFEQLINGYYLQKLGYGLMSENFDYDILKQFLENIDTFSDKLATYHPAINTMAMQEFDKAIKKVL